MLMPVGEVVTQFPTGILLCWCHLLYPRHIAGVKLANPETHNKRRVKIDKYRSSRKLRRGLEMNSMR